MHLGGRRIQRIGSITLFSLAAATIAVILSSLQVFAVAPPNTISYQGRLLDANGSPITAATANMQFRLYDSLAGGTCLYSNDDTNCATDDDQSVTITDGLFSENLGDTGAGYAAIDPDIFSDDASVYLEVEVEGEVLSPRRPFTAAPYALNAHALDGLASSDFDLDQVYGADTDQTLTVDDASGLTFDITDPSGFFEVNGVSAGTTQTDGLVRILGASSTDGYENVSLNFTATDDTAADTISNLYVSTNPGDSLDTLYGLYVVGADTAANLALTSLAVFEHLETADTLDDAIIVRGAGPITTGINLSDADIVDALNVGNNTIAFDDFTLGQSGSTTIEASIAGFDVFSIHHVASGQVYAKFGVPTSAPSDDAALDLGVPDVTRNQNVPVFRSNEFTQTFTTNGASYTGANALHTNILNAPTFDFGLTSSSYEAATLYIDAAPVITGAASGTTRALYVDSGLVDFNDSVRIGSDNGDSLNVTGSVFIDDGNSTTQLRVGSNFASFSSAFQVLDANAGFAALVLNDGNSNNNQGLSIQACDDTTVTAACNFIEFRDGDGDILGAIEGDGAGGITNASAGSDYAELFPGTYASFGEGNILALESDGSVALAEPHQTSLGVFSVAPNTLGNWRDDWRSMGTFVPVGLLGQLPVNVNSENGSIQAGDAIAVSSVPGVGAKAMHTGMVIGYALESWSGVGEGQIQVFVRPGFFAGPIQTDGSMLAFGQGIALSATGTATLAVQGFDSELLSFRGSGWDVDSSSAQEVGFSVRTAVDSAEAYRLSYKNAADVEVAYITEAGSIHVSGDTVIGGKLYPSDRGTPQSSKYIYYDGSTGPGGDFIRTNAAGWSTGSYDFAEMFPAEGSPVAGDVVAFSKTAKETIKKSGSQDAQRLAGIVSTRPGFLAGENTAGQVPVALAGRVPTHVTTENGKIEIGDPLTVSATRPGYAMKATGPGPIVGYALEPLEATEGTIVVFVRVSYFDGSSVGVPGTTTIVSGGRTALSGTQNLKALNMEGDIYLQGNKIVNIGRLVGLSNAWSIEADGTIQTSGSFVAVLKSFQDEDVPVAAVLSPEQILTLSGSAVVRGGETVIQFEDISPTFNDVISTTAPIRVLVTPGVPTSLYVTDKSHNGFTVHEVGGGAADVAFDFVVYAYRAGFEPVEEVELAKEESAEDVEEAPPEEEVLSEEPQQEEVVEEIVEEEDSSEEEVTEEVAPEESEAPLEPSEAIDESFEEDTTTPVVVE